MKEILFFMVCLFWGSTAFANSLALTAQQIERVKILKANISDVDFKTLSKTIDDIEQADDPEMVLQIRETIAIVYASIVKEQSIQDQQTKEWLYQKVSLNMANLQFGGGVGRDPVNHMMIKKLRHALPKDIMKNPNFHVSVE